MEERIRSQVKDRKPKEVEELNLDNVRASTVTGLSEEFTALKQLSLINVGLMTVEGLPGLPALERLELADNKLTGGLVVLTKCPKLRQLSLAGNRITSVDDLKPLSELSLLTSLDLLDCPVTRQDGYRESVFSQLPFLQVLDGLSREGEEVESESEEEEREGEEEEEEEESGSDEPGLAYLQKDLGSESSGESEDYDPEGEEPPADDDIIASSSGEEGEGPSRSKKPRLDPDPDRDSD